MADEETQFRNRAVVGLVVALGLGVGGWIFLGRLADSGIARLATIDRLRASCTSQWQSAQTAIDSARVDSRALPDTIDPRSAAALKRCGDLRAKLPAARANAREMSGEPMPRGLR